MICQKKKCKKRARKNAGYCRYHQICTNVCTDINCNSTIPSFWRYCGVHKCRVWKCNNRKIMNMYCKDCICVLCGELKNKKFKNVCLHCMCLYSISCSPCLNLAKYNLGNVKLIHELTNIPDDVIKYVIIPMTGARKGHCQRHS